ncbi:hypothetical protein GF324_10010 [bacterium]|nr:hypothetical protein [bacterium]
MREAFEEAGLEVDADSIERLTPETLRQVDWTEPGVLGPAHGFTAPWALLSFVARMPRGRGRNAFVVMTRGSLMAGRLQIPGLAGNGPFLLALLLFLKGYRVRAIDGIHMPSNWMSLHSAQPRQPGDVIHGRAEATTERFARRWIDRRIHWFTWNNLYEFIGGALLLYISFLYLIAGLYMACLRAAAVRVDRRPVPRRRLAYGLPANRHRRDAAADCCDLPRAVRLLPDPALRHEAAVPASAVRVQYPDTLVSPVS